MQDSWMGRAAFFSLLCAGILTVSACQVPMAVEPVGNNNEDLGVLSALPVRTLQALPQGASAGWQVQGNLRLTRRWWSFFAPTYDVWNQQVKVGVLRRISGGTRPMWRLMDSAGGDLASMALANPATHYQAVLTGVDGRLLAGIQQTFRRRPVNPTLCFVNCMPEKGAFNVSLRVFGPPQGPGRVELLRAKSWRYGFTQPVSVSDGNQRELGLIIPAGLKVENRPELMLTRPLEGRLALALLAAQLDAQDLLHRNPGWVSADN
jgi:hypothetical protein